MQAPNIFGQASPDQTANYNTPLSAREEQAFQQWRATLPRDLQNTRDYDLRGAWKANAKAAGNGHLPDTWKKPNHPTFSDGSIYNGPYTPAGSWVEQPGGKWTYFGTPTSSRYGWDQKAEQDYFQRVEPGNNYVPPANPNIFSGR